MADHDPAREEIHKQDGTSAAHPAPTERVAAEGVSPDAASEAKLLERFPDAVFHESHGQPVVYIPRASWHDVAAFLRDEERFTQCVDVTVVDHLADEQRAVIGGVAPQRFEVVANFLSHSRNRRLRTICEVPADDATVPSITDLYPGANFGEREAFDLFGVTFEGHPDLTRILMPDDWAGYPLRKDDAPSRVPVAFKDAK